jgi:hypothetical protein
MAQQLNVDELFSFYLALERADQLRFAALIKHHIRIQSAETTPANEDDDGDSHVRSSENTTSDRHTDDGSSASAAAPPAAGTEGGRDKSSRKSKDQAAPRYYVVTQAEPHLLGIHHCYWMQLLRKLPDGQLKDWRGRQRGFDTLRAALAYWHVHHLATDPIIHNDG